MSSLWDYVWIALFLALALGQSEDPFAEFDTDETVVIEPDDYDIEVCAATVLNI
jgi:hypothetical protein